MNLLGRRDPSIYGTTDLDTIIDDLSAYGRGLGASIAHFQSNSEGVLIDKIQEATNAFDGIVFNPGALSHYSYALRDAISSIDIPVIEVHISNISARESFRNISVIAPVCIGQISGLGSESYRLALDYFIRDLGKLNSDKDESI